MGAEQRIQGQEIGISAEDAKSYYGDATMIQGLTKLVLISVWWNIRKESFI